MKRGLLLSLVLLNLEISKVAVAADAVFEPGVGSVWFDTGDGSLGADNVLLMEWTARGEIVPHTKDFSSFDHFSSLFPFDLKSLSTYKGQFAVWSNYQYFYSRDGFHLRRHNVFEEHPYLGCKDDVNGPCLMLPFNIPVLGSTLLVVDRSQMPKIWKAEGSGYRTLSDLERRIADVGASTVLINQDLTFYAASCDGSCLVQYVGNQGVLEQKIDQSEGFSFDAAELFRVGQDTHLVAYAAKADTDERQVVVYKIVRSEDKIELNPLVTQDLVAGGTSYVTAASQNGFSFVSGANVFSFNKDSLDLSVIYECAAGSITDPRTSTGDVSEKGLGVCGSKVLNILSDSVEEVQFSFVVKAVSVVRDHPEGRVLIASDHAGNLALVRPDGSQIQKAYRIAPEKRDFKAVWLEGPRVCGLATDDAAVYACQGRNGEWESVPAPFGLITSLSRIGGVWSMLSVSGDETVLSRFDEVGLRWVSIASLPFSSRQLQFVDTADQRTVIQADDRTFILEDGALSESYPRERLADGGGFNPIIDAGGLLYDGCSSSDGKPVVCLFQRDGSRVVTEVPVFSTSLQRNVPLKRGVLIAGIYVMRGARAIMLSQLFPDINYLSKVSSIDGTGEALLGNVAYQPSGAVLTLYRFDGSKMIGPNDEVATLARGRTPTLPNLFQVSDRLHKSKGVFARRGNRERVVSGLNTQSDFVFRNRDGSWSSLSAANLLTVSDKWSALWPINEPKTANIIRSAKRTEAGGVLFANEFGVWSCGRDDLTVVGPETDTIPLTSSCRIARMERNVKGIFVHGGRVVLHRGLDLVALSSLDSNTETVLNASPITGRVQQDSGMLYWMEGERYRYYDMASEYQASHVISGLADDNASALMGHICSDRGLYVVGGDGVRQVMMQCDAVTAVDGVLYAVAQGRLFSCSSGTCRTVAALPMRWAADARLGSITRSGVSRVAAAFGTKMFAMGEGGEFEFLPLTYGAGRPLPIKAVMTIDEGLITTSDAGLLVVDDADRSDTHGYVRFE